jgi:hypothetical protein
LYLWGVAGTRLEDVQIVRKSSLGSERSSLQINFGELTQARAPITGAHLWRPRNLTIRIPEGQESAAQIVLESLRNRLPAERNDG